MEHLNCCTGTRIGKYSLQFSIEFFSILQWSSQSPGLLAECGLILFWPSQQLEIWTLERQQQITKCRPGIWIWMPVCISSRNINKLVMLRSWGGWKLIIIDSQWNGNYDDVIISLQKTSWLNYSGYHGYTQGGETVGYERFTFEWNTNCIRLPYNYNTLTTLRTLWGNHYQAPSLAWVLAYICIHTHQTLT